MQPNLTPELLPPFYELAGEVFEGLCRDLLAEQPGIVTCSSYGVSGQRDRGVDVLAQRNAGGALAGQCKAYHDLQPGGIRKASDDFLKYAGHWHSQGVVRFMLLVGGSLAKTAQQDAISNERRRFEEAGFEYEAWSNVEITRALRPHPALVARYCTPAEYWIERICGQPTVEQPTVEQPEQAGTRLSLGNLPPPADAGNIVERGRWLDELDSFWADKSTTIVQIVADGGVGKSTLVWSWLDRMRLDGYGAVRSAIDWSFYIQGQHHYATDSQRFFDLALDHFSTFGLRLGASQRRNAELVGRHTAEAFVRAGGILILDGVEPLQYPPHQNDGRLMDQGLVSLLRNLRVAPPPGESGTNRLLLITTRWPIPDLAGAGIERIDLDTFTEEEGVTFLRGFHLPHRPGVSFFAFPKGDQAQLDRELRAVVREYSGHALALLLLASYLIRHFDGSLAARIRVPAVPELGHKDPHRHARRVMRSYARMFEEDGSPGCRACRQLLCLVSLFDRPAPVSVLEAALAGTPLASLTSELAGDGLREAIDETTSLRLLQWYRLREVEVVDLHPLVREHFRTESDGRERRVAHQRIASYLERTANPSPRTVEDLDPLFHAIAHACKSGRYGHAFHGLYTERVMQGRRFADTELGAYGPLLSALSQFFEQGAWGRFPGDAAGPEQELAPIDKSRLLLDVGTFLRTTQGWAADEVKTVFSDAVRFSQLKPISAQAERQRFQALWDLWAFETSRGEHTEGRALAEQIIGLAGRLQEPGLSLAAEHPIGQTLFHTGHFREAADRLQRGLVPYDFRESPRTVAEFGFEVAVIRLSSAGHALWCLGEPAQALARSSDAIMISEEIGNDFSIALAFAYDAVLQQLCRDPETALHRADASVAICYECGFSYYLAWARVLRGWAICELGDAEAGIAETEAGLEDFRLAGGRVREPFYLSVLAEVCMAAGCRDRAGDLVAEAVRLAQQRREVWHLAELLRLQGDLFVASGPRELRRGIRSLRAAVELAREQEARTAELRALLSLCRAEPSARGKAGYLARLAELTRSFSAQTELAELVEARETLAGAPEDCKPRRL